MPQFTSSDRYWGSYRYRDRLKIVILLSTVYFLLSVGFETLPFAIDSKSNGAYQWYLFRLKLLMIFLLICGSRLYIVGLIYPWPLAIWIVAVLILVQYRVALQRKVLGIIRIDRLLTTIFPISSLFGLFHAFASLILTVVKGESLGWGFLLWDICNSTFLFISFSGICWLYPAFLF